MAGMIENNAGMINQDTGLINDNTGMITETKDTEYTASGRRKHSRERGMDRKPRNFPLHTIKNLPQFRDKSHEEVRQYILEKKGVDIGSNFNFGSMMLWILVGFVVVAGGIGIAKLWQQWQERKNNENITDTSSRN